MPRYKILELSFIGNVLVQPGTEIESDDIPAAHWEPLDKAAKLASKASADEEAQRVEVARKDAGERAAKEAAVAVPAAPPQEVARAKAESKAAAKAAEKAAESPAGQTATEDPLA